jgi:hypothetical protein
LLGTDGAFNAANRKHRGVHNYVSRSHSHASGLLNQGGDTESPFNQLSVSHGNPFKLSLVAIW